MKTLTAIGRIVYGLPFIVFGIFHFMRSEGMANNIIPNWPIPEIIVYLSGAAIILGGLALLINKYAKLASFLLAIFLLLTILTIHVPGTMDPETQQMAMTSMLKDLGLLGGALVLASILKN